MKKIIWSLGISVLLLVFFIGCSRTQLVEEKTKQPDESASEVKGQEQIREFLNCRIVPQLGNSWDYTFGPGKFPELEWDKPYLVEKVMGKFPLKARWFNSEFEEVSSPQEPGRYAFYVEGKTPTGKVIRRASTVYCRPKYWLGWSEKPRAYLDFLPVDGIDRSVWREHEDAIATFAGRTVLLSILRQQEGAILMSYLHEMETSAKEPSLTDTPLIRDHEYHLTLKRKILDVEKKYPPLRMPQETKAKKAAVLRDGPEEEAGFRPGTADRIRKVCRAWG